MLKQCAAVLMLCALMYTPVLAEDGSKIEVYDYTQRMTFINAPFIQNGEIYLPLRETLNFFGLEDIRYSPENGGAVSIHAGEFFYSLTIGSKEISIVSPVQYSLQKTQPNLRNAPIIINNLTYAPNEFFAKMRFSSRALLKDFAVCTNLCAESAIDEIFAVRIWADALYYRDGRPRYDIMTETLKSAFIAEQRRKANNGEWYYNIGVSSPYLIYYDIRIDADKTAEITYHLSDSGGGWYDLSENLAFEKSGGSTLVSAAEESHVVY
ncbi:MAG: stalk domain-containing protein [Clostridia bacterium]|nr:stalk domain-containing protein [Clostridia bacterium]